MAVIGSQRVSVAPQAITKASRLFNAGLRDILNELFQNSRRAGASSIRVSVCKGSRSFACIEDDGEGMFANGVSIALGGSGWSESVQNREDPFGGGIFSLAHRGATFEGSGKRVTLSPAQFAGDLDYEIEESDYTAGTRITFPLLEGETTLLNKRMSSPEIEATRFSQACETAALYFPLPVTLDGIALMQKEFLYPAIYREVWEGIEIGVCRVYYGTNNQLNFYGVVVEQNLPRVSMVDDKTGYGIRANVLNSPRLKLVLPARKEVFQDAFFEEFKFACERAIYRAIATLPDHSLAFSKWQRAKELGVDLEEALPALTPYEFPVSDSSESYGYDVQEIAEDAVVVTASLEAPEAQTIERALFGATGSGKLYHRTLYTEVQSYKGYSWYDALPRYEGFDILVGMKGETIPIKDAVTRLQPKERADRIIVRACFLQENSKPIFEEYETDVALWADPDSCWSLDDAYVVLTHNPAIDPDDLADLLFNAYFYSSEDSEADSYDTQKEEFMEEVRAYAMSLLVSEEEALKARIAEAAERHLGWIVPRGMTATVTINREVLTFEVTLSK